MKLPRIVPFLDVYAVALERALKLDPKERFETMEALLDELAEPASKRWVLPAVLGSVALGAVLWTQAQPAAPPPDPCAGGPKVLAQVWNPAERDRLAASLSKVEALWAKDTKIRSLARIDAWGESFVSAHREACEATEVLHTQSPKMHDLRMLCLDRRLRRLEAIKETLHEGG